MSAALKARAHQVDVVPVDHLLARLRALRQQHRDLGKVSHAAGVQAAIDMILRDLERTRRRPNLDEVQPPTQE